MGARFALARQQGLTEELVAELPHFENSRKLTGQEKAAIRYAEILAGDHRQASQQTFDVLREHFTEGEIVHLKRATITLSDDIEEAVERYVAAHEARPPLTAVVQAALRQYLTDRGYL